MNTTKYMQTDSRWSNLGYPKSPCTIGNSGCGEVSIVNAIIEMAQYAKYTPATIQPYCKQHAAPNCDGTYWSAIPIMMKHYGLTEVKEHDTMPQLFKELTKGNRVAIYLMGSRRGGSKGIHWTSSGHFICSTGYQYKNGKNYLYVKDSYSNSKDRNGWITYEENMKGDVLKVWSGKLTGKLADGTVVTAVKGTSKTPTTTTNTSKLVVDGIGGTATVKRMQQFFGCSSTDGIISGQNKSYSQLYPALTSVQYGKGGSKCIVALQKWLGLSNPDGIIGKNTTNAWQKKLRDLGYLAKNESIDGIIGVKTMKAWQECLNNSGKKKGGSPTPTPDPKPTPSKTDLKVIDVSEFQDAINWTKAKADGVKGAIVRCGYRGYESGTLKTDSMFLNHIKGAYKAGIPVGIYMFTEAKTEKEGREEADYAIKLWQTAGVPLSFPIAVDTEPSGGSKDRCKNLTRAQRTNAIKGFCERIKAKGYEPMIYASTSWLNTKLDMSKLPYKVWCAQYYSKCEYKGSYIMWQYTSEGRVNGIKGNVDLNHCYIQPKAVNPPKSIEKKGYTGKFPEYRLVKNNAKTISDTCKWAKWIANGVDFHYGCNDHAFHNGCYFCGTNDKFKKGHGIKMWETTYCCNPFVGAAWAHGGGDATAYKMCHNCESWGFSKNEGYEKSSLFDKLGKPAKSKLKAGDVLCNHTHVALYVGDGQIAEASGLDDNVYGSTKWKNSIAVKTLTDSKYKTFERVYRYNGTVNTDRPLTNGEVSDRVADMQRFLVWYGSNDISVNGIFDARTLKAVKAFQEKEMGKGQGDGIVGLKTIDAMKKVKK